MLELFPCHSRRSITSTTALTLCDVYLNSKRQRDQIGLAVPNYLDAVKLRYLWYLGEGSATVIPAFNDSIIFGMNLLHI